MLDRFLQNLERYGSFSPQDRAAVLRLPLERRSFAAGEEIVAEGAKPSRVCILNKGMAMRYKLLADGRRQIMAFYVPGDALDVHGVFLTMDHSVGALTACEAAFVPHAAVEATIGAHPAVARALWRWTLVDGAVFREWMVGMGRRSAYARIAHLFCELLVRLEAAGLAQRNRASLPLTQQHLGDALGLSVVHTNRVLQALRRDGLITFRNGQLVAVDWDGLRVAGEFEPAYLHLDDPAARELRSA
jgi:CRP-like cAMP-binding protein